MALAPVVRPYFVPFLFLSWDGWSLAIAQGVCLGIVYTWFTSPLISQKPASLTGVAIMQQLTVHHWISTEQLQTEQLNKPYGRGRPLTSDLLPLGLNHSSYFVHCLPIRAQAQRNDENCKDWPGLEFQSLQKFRTLNRSRHGCLGSFFSNAAPESSPDIERAKKRHFQKRLSACRIFFLVAGKSKSPRLLPLNRRTEHQDPHLHGLGRLILRKKLLERAN
ncbi:hypothetical protein EJB05_50080, partial [Eragrostis curvula]